MKGLVFVIVLSFGLAVGVSAQDWIPRKGTPRARVHPREHFTFAEAVVIGSNSMSAVPTEHAKSLLAEVAPHPVGQPPRLHLQKATGEIDLAFTTHCGEVAKRATGREFFYAWPTPLLTAVVDSLGDTTAFVGIVILLQRDADTKAIVERVRASGASYVRSVLETVIANCPLCSLAEIDSWSEVVAIERTAPPGTVLPAD